jgi:hypothetical protein
MRRIIALFISDPHLSLTPPIWRSAEPDWLAAQARPFEELNKLQQRYDCPIFCAGDIFDKWCGVTGSGGAELINWAIEHLPKMYAIPGQHDLPNHSLKDIKCSAYWTLIKAGKIINIEKEKPIKLEKHRLKIYGFPWGTNITKCYDKIEGWTHIALVHSYIWYKSYKYTGAPITQNIENYKNIFSTYDIVSVGDNHSGWTYEIKH